MDKPFAIFDMDGTLIDSMIFWKGLASEYLSSKGITHIPADILEQIKPMTMSESAVLFQQEFGLTGDPEAEMNAIMDAHYRNDIPLKPGVWEYLQLLHINGIRMGVASATAEHLMELSGSGVDGVAVVSAIFAAEDPGKATSELLVLARKMVSNG